MHRHRKSTEQTPYLRLATGTGMANSSSNNSSSSRSSSIEDLEQKLTCSICLQLFSEPRLLPCGHTYCQLCLQSYISSRAVITNSRGQQGFHCPVCREFTAAPDRIAPAPQWAAMFKPNFLIRDIVEVHGKSKAQKVTRPPCPRHPGKTQELYCRDCRTCICDRCAALEHRRCEEVVELAEVTRETQQAARRHQQTVLRLLKQLEAKKKRCLTGRRELERIERDMDAKIEREGQELLRKVADFLRNRKETLKRQAHAHCRQCVSVVNAYTDKCDELTGALRSLDRVLSNKLRPDGPQNKVLDAHQEESKVNAMVHKLETAVQQLDSPCHFTVRLIMDDSALNAILANLKLGEIRTGDHHGPCSEDAALASTGTPPARPFSPVSGSNRPLSACSAASLHSASVGSISGLGGHVSGGSGGGGGGYSSSGRSTPVSDHRPASAASSAFSLYYNAYNNNNNSMNSNYNNSPSSPPPPQACPYSPPPPRSLSPFLFPAATSSPNPSPPPLPNKKRQSSSALSDYFGFENRSDSAQGSNLVGAGAMSCPQPRLQPPPPQPQRQRGKSVSKIPFKVHDESAFERAPIQRKLSQ